MMFSGIYINHEHGKLPDLVGLLVMVQELCFAYIKCVFVT